MADIPVEAFLTLRHRFFTPTGEPIPFPLRDKRNTQDDPFDEFLATDVLESVHGISCLKAPGPLITPDLVLYRPDRCARAPRADVGNDLDSILAIEVKKLERTDAGGVARASGLDYNTTPPCGRVRVYDVRRQLHLHGVGVRAGRCRCRRRRVRMCRQRAVHHDGLMAAGRILADGIGMSPGARERVRRFGPAPRSVRSSARCSPARRLIPSCAIGSLVALVVGLVDRLGTSRLRACWGDRHRGADRKRLDWVALIRPMVM